ncbi:MAG: hypothetical protein ACYSUI_08135 [Planctomycetota bacterium]|jgi:hypothetical protein
MKTALVHSQVHLGTPDKMLSLATWALAAALFASVGWMALQPDDPHGAVSLLTPGVGWLSVLEILALSAIVSGLATVLVGRKLPDAGVFAVSLGLAVAALRGDTTTYLLITLADGDAAVRGTMAWKLAAEGSIWFLAVLTAMITAGLVMRWQPGTGDEEGSASCRAMWGGWLAEPEQSTDTSVGRLDGLKTTFVSLAAATIVFRLLATGSPLRSVQHGQTYFALIAAFYLGGLIAYELYPVRSAFWGCLSVPLLCLLGYFICAVSSSSGGQYSRIASVPPSSFYRALPIEYISVGTAAAVASFWSARRSALLRRVAAKGRGPAAHRT